MIIKIIPLAFPHPPPIPTVYRVLGPVLIVRDHFQFRDEETKAQRCLATGPKSHS